MRTYVCNKVFFQYVGTVLYHTVTMKKLSEQN